VARTILRSVKDNVQSPATNPEKALPELPETRKENRRPKSEQRIRQLIGEKRALERELDSVRANLAQLTAEAFAEETQREQLRAEVEQEFAAGVAEMRRNFPDFDAVLGGPAELPAELLDEIKDNPCGPLLLYQIGRNPALHYRLSNVPVRVARHEIRRMCVELWKAQEQRSQQRQAAELYYQSIHLEAMTEQ
jgi:hypothetical protein